jgi:hypothetical protein
VSGQSNEQLCRWTVLNDSALEESWAAIVDSGRTDDRIDFANLHRDNSIRRWPTCGSFGDCFEQVNRGAASDQTPDCAATGAKIQYIVSFETIVWHEFRLHPEYCDTLEVVGTSETLFDFNAGWIYADVDNGTLGRSQRREIDEGIRTVRRDRMHRRKGGGVRTAVPGRALAGQLDAYAVPDPGRVAVADMRGAAPHGPVSEHISGAAPAGEAHES